MLILTRRLVFDEKQRHDAPYSVYTAGAVDPLHTSLYGGGGLLSAFDSLFVDNVVK